MAGERAALDGAARLAARTHQARRLLGFEECFEVAWLGAAEAWAGGERGERDLLRAGLAAINGEVESRTHHHGLPDRKSRTGAKFATYWRGGERTVSPFEDGVVERIAVTQVYYGLTERDRQVLLAAAWGTEHGYSAAAWPGVLSRARRRARKLWFEPEPAPPHYQAGRLTRYRHRNGITYPH